MIDSFCAELLYMSDPEDTHYETLKYIKRQAYSIK